MILISLLLFYLCRIKHDRSANDLGPSVGTENGRGPRFSTNLTDLPEVNQGTHVPAPTAAKKLPLLNSEITDLNNWKLMEKNTNNSSWVLDSISGRETKELTKSERRTVYLSFCVWTNNSAWLGLPLQRSTGYLYLCKAKYIRKK